MKGSTNSTEFISVKHSTPQNHIGVTQYGKIVMLSVYGLPVTPNSIFYISNLPKSVEYAMSPVCGPNSAGWTGTLEINQNSTQAFIYSTSQSTVYGQLMYICE